MALSLDFFNVCFCPFNCSFAFVVEPKGFPFSPGPTSASSAKSKTSQILIFFYDLCAVSLRLDCGLLKFISPSVYLFPGLCVHSAVKRYVPQDQLVRQSAVSSFKHLNFSSDIGMVQ